ncbi:MAG: dTMP kinase [Fimbriimonas sp.]
MLITFEGPEGAGKSTAIVAIAEKLRGTGCDVLTTREPGSGDFGERIRTLLLEGPDVEKKVELMLFLADRANHVQTVIKPAIDQGKVVLCDRYTDSTIAYQGYAQGLDIEFLRRANDFVTDGLQPDFTILFDITPEVGLARLGYMDRMDSLPLEFHQRVRLGYLREAHAEPRRWLVLDASRPREQVMEDVVRVLMSRLR